MSIEETAKALDNAIAVYVMAVARDASTGETATSSGAREQMKAAIRAYGRAALEEAEALSQYTCHATCDHHEDYCLTTQRSMLRREIEERR